MNPDGSLRVTVTDGHGRPIRDDGLGLWLASVAPGRVRGEVAIALAPDSRIRSLNQRYRRKNFATDVLAFPAATEPAPSGPSRRFLGDIIIATGVAKRQAREMRHAYRTELRVLALHGLLHLLGYDHEHHADRGRMARAEARLRRKGGLSSGLIGRTPRAASTKKRPQARRERGRVAATRNR